VVQRTTRFTSFSMRRMKNGNDLPKTFCVFLSSLSGMSKARDEDFSKSATLELLQGSAVLLK